MIRLFVGIGPPEPVLERLAGLCAGLPRARWIEPANMHVTLRFIGEVDEGTARDLHDALAEIHAPAFPLALAGTGTFGAGSRNHTLWVGVERVAALARLRDKIESAVVRTGLAPERRKFSPHLTIARLHDAPSSRLRDYLSGQGLFRAEPFMVRHFTLFSSHLGRAGASYTAEAEYPLDDQGHSPSVISLHGAQGFPTDHA